MNETRPGAIGTKPMVCVVVFYEDSAAREKAVRFCDRMVERVWARQEFQVKWWDFKSLKDPTLLHDVYRHSLDADVIVFATSPGGELPEELHEWIESWIPLRADREGAVVGLQDPGADFGEFCPAKFLYFRNAAHRAGMDYWTDVPQNLSRSVPDSPDSYSERARYVTSVLDEILHHHPAPSF